MKSYSRLEKDFLGNERMVHYDEKGVVVGASEVVREEDGTLRVLDSVPVAPAETVTPALSNMGNSVSTVASETPQAKTFRQQMQKLEETAPGASPFGSSFAAGRSSHANGRPVILFLLMLIAFLLTFAAGTFLINARKPVVLPPNFGEGGTATPQDSPFRNPAQVDPPVQPPSNPYPGDNPYDSPVPSDIDRDMTDPERRQNGRPWIEGAPNRSSNEPAGDERSGSTKSSKVKPKPEGSVSPKKNPDDPIDLGRDDGGNDNSGNDTAGSSGGGAVPPPDQKPPDTDPPSTIPPNMNPPN